jgi:uncharacterized protein YbjQ (UPF0145 family)/DNA-directed RNA polymerase subunit M/transcription elongation factor TFIIS
MGECIGCGKKIGMLTGRIKISNDKELCDQCYYVFSTKLNIMKSRKTEADVEKAYTDVVNEISQHNYLQNSKPIIIKYIQNEKDEMFKVFQMEREKLAKLQQEKENEILLQQKHENIKLTTGYSFEGYAIKKYHGVISGESVIGTGFLSELSASLSDLGGMEDEMFANKLSMARASALKQLIHKAVILDGNAIIGISFDYITFTNNMMGVIANGTTVEIESI